MTLLPPGIWCPWAEILCFECHGPKTLSGDDVLHYDECLKYRQCRVGEEMKASCDKCNQAVWMRVNVALEQRVVVAVKALQQSDLRAQMAQTGGMCSAARAECDKHEGHYALVTVDETDEEAYFVGFYNDEDDDYLVLACTDVDAVVQALQTWASGSIDTLEADLDEDYPR